MRSETASPAPDAAVVDGDRRRSAASLAARYLDGTVTRDVLCDSLDGSDDPLIRELLVAITHEPVRGFLGVSERRWQRSFREPVARMIAELEKGEAGRIPDERLLLRAGVWALVRSAVGTVWAGGFAAEHAILGLGSETAPIWQRLLRATAAIVMLLVAAAFALAFQDRLVLYRLRRRSRQRS